MTATVPEREMSPELVEQMRPVWEAAYEALRTDMGTLEDLARAAARAAAARDERVAQGVEVVTDGRPQRVLLTAAEKRKRKADAQRRYRAQKAAEKVEAERAARAAAVRESGT